MLLARELPGITVPEAFLSQDIRLAREMIEKAAYLGFAVCSYLNAIYGHFFLTPLASPTQNGDSLRALPTGL